MRAGNLNRRVLFQSRTLTPGQAGARTETWADAFEAWAEVRDLSATERNAAPKEQVVRVTTFRIRYRAGVTETMRIVYEGRNYDITGIRDIDENGRRVGLELAAEFIQV